MPLSVDQVRRFARHISLSDVGPTGQERLLGATAVVCGGGLAAQIAKEYLMAAGVGQVVMGEFGQRATVAAILSPHLVEVRSFRNVRGEAVLTVNEGGSGAEAVIAGTLAATELLWRLLRGDVGPEERVLTLPLDGGEPVAKECP